ncbi:hypothetical protein QT970_31115 [Microcoleus sp. herbarium8]|uniref:hypothetical protein n=1 Tax=Microcoleus sp. herbarium8 TaxID=3055436 RepID=UPI002FD18B1A
MKRDRWLSGLFLAGMLCVMLGTVGAQVAQAQRTIHILDLKCLPARSKSILGIYKNQQDIIVGREIYTSVMTANANSAMTCRLPGGRASLRLEFAIPDNFDIPPVKIDIYVDGNQVASRTGDKGKVHTLLADISNGKSLSIEISCARATNCGGWSPSYYFMKAQIEPGASSPGSR